MYVKETVFHVRLRLSHGLWRMSELPWKFCPTCKEISYSAATHYDAWPCPHCGRELRNEPEYDIKQAKALREQNSQPDTVSKAEEQEKK